MKKIYYIQSAEYDLVASIDDEDQVRYLIDNEDFPEDADDLSAEEYLKNIEDDSDWYTDMDEVQLYDMLSTEEVLAEIESDI